MECSVTQVGVSEFCETLTGGFTRKTPRRSNSQKSENLEEWNTQSGGIARGVELPVDSLLPFIKSRLVLVMFPYELSGYGLNIMAG